MSDLFKYSKEQMINALSRVRREYPAVYRNFFLFELERPWTPFLHEDIVIIEGELPNSEENEDTPIPSTVRVPYIKIEE